jgi:hypothetical protein
VARTCLSQSVSQFLIQFRGVNFVRWSQDANKEVCALRKTCAESSSRESLLKTLQERVKQQEAEAGDLKEKLKAAISGASHAAANIDNVKLARDHPDSSELTSAP